jgi:predicted MPP superfamily phosphohydrolase
MAVPLFIPARLGDLFVVVCVVLTQFVLVRFLVRDWKSALRPAVWYGIFATLAIIWTISGIGMLLDVYSVSSSTKWVATLRRGAVGIELLWGCFSVFAVTVYAILRRFAGPHPEQFSESRRSLLRKSTMVAMAAPFAVIGYGTFIERTRFFVKEVDLPMPGLHPDLVGKRLVQLSDLHVSSYLSVSDAARVVDMANELRADLALVTGDLISDVGDPLEETIREVGRLRAIAGIVGCHGNHEIYARCQNLASRLCRVRGIDILRHRSRQFKFGSGILNVAGVDYQPASTKSMYLRGCESLVVPGAANLLMSHSPDVFPVAVHKGFDAIVSGHTHAGQVTIEILNQTLNVARFLTPYVAGLYRIDGRSGYVTAGIGTIGMPIRIGAPPEITLLRLQRA